MALTKGPARAQKAVETLQMEDLAHVARCWLLERRERVGLGLHIRRTINVGDWRGMTVHCMRVDGVRRRLIGV